MIIRRHEAIAGRAAPEIRRLLREIGSLHVSPGFAQDVLGCSVREAVRVMLALQKAGYVSRQPGKEPCM